ncbi:MAG: PspA/IM30 family protein [Paraglaciecola sp.]|uniref:PspA/IM30 family protein n=1 Tax=Pseudomonadati TaxID=3379134 RepID=UPI00273F5864|nr:PspA/IM30 family protein [Paraglaciecola sp.]MDP5030202.1 PspA/IM30 family protein [Paraglaciecola sp.]MDP5131251.1 PspA/IM30 family protein [Paraglaciecola sp.]
MGLISRMSDIVQANVNAILDKAEDPAKVLKLLIQEMDEALVELRSVAASNLAEKKRIQRKSEKMALQVEAWQAKAALAMEKQREDLARAALAEKHQCQQKLCSYEAELSCVETSLTDLQADTAKLHEKLTEARLKQNSLVIRERSAAVRLQVKANTHADRIEAAIGRFEHYERRIDDLESQVDAYDLVSSSQDLNSQFVQLEAAEKIEHELAMLRKKVA